MRQPFRILAASAFGVLIISNVINADGIKQAKSYRSSEPFVPYSPYNIEPINDSQMQWPPQQAPLSDDRLARIAARMTSPEIVYDFNRTLDNICIERQPGTRTHAQVRRFIAAELRGLGWAVDERSFTDSTPFGQKPFTNIIATLDPTACHRLVLACHYDSKVAQNLVTATDSAVPCSQMINIVKALQPELLYHRYRRTGLSLQLIFFDGEEAFKRWSDTDSLYGSRRLASELQQIGFYPGPENRCGTSTGKQLRNELDRIQLFVLLDLLGAKNPSFHNYYAETSELFNHMASTELRLNGLGLMEGQWTRYFADEGKAQDVADDHLPFLHRGVRILHLISIPYPPGWHTPLDNKQNLDWPTIRNLNKLFAAFLIWYMDL